ncbi:MAG TPA: aldo/keto reductase [Edaphobacter sp.]|nr:aldo/keto reductase [Edaphobacter sp.]
MGFFARAVRRATRGTIFCFDRIEGAGKDSPPGFKQCDGEAGREAQEISPVVCVQNQYNLAKREDDALIDSLAQQGIAYVPFFPLGGFSPLQSSTLDNVAKELNRTPMQVALAWLLQRAPNILLIPGTSSVKHLKENLQTADIELTPEIARKLDEVGK